MLAKRFKGLGGTVSQLSRSQLSRAGVTPCKKALSRPEIINLYHFDYRVAIHGVRVGQTKER